MKNDAKRFLEGKRIYLRDVNIDDVNDNYYRWINDSDVIRYTESRFYPQSLSDIKKYVEQTRTDTDSVFLAIILNEDNSHIGNIKIHRINWIHRHAEMSILIGEKSCWGQGLGPEAIGLVTEYAFNNLNLYKVYAECYANNKSSIEAFQKAGFEREGSLKEHYFFNGVYIDGIRMCVFKR